MLAKFEISFIIYCVSVTTIMLGLTGGETPGAI